MGLIEQLVDRLNAMALSNEKISVHTSDGGVGLVQQTDVFRGRITVALNGGQTKTYLGREVADLDTPISETK